MEDTADGDSETRTQHMKDYAQTQEHDQKLRRKHNAGEVQQGRDEPDEKQDLVRSEYQRQDGVQQEQQLQEESEEIVDSFSSFIQERLYDLPRMTSLQFGLLDELSGNNVLDPEQIELIRKKAKNFGEAKQLFEEISSKPMSDGVKMKFFNALDQTLHKHVSNFIRGNAVRATEYGDEWPLFCMGEELTKFQQNRRKLIELLDSRNGLLDEMLAANCINIRQRQSVMSCSTDAEKNEQLIRLLHRGSLATYETFIRCLLLTKQHLVVSLLKPSLVGVVCPLTDIQQSRLKRNYPTLLRTIITKDGLTAELLAADCITWRQREYIEQPTITQSESNERLLDIVMKGKETDFHRFIECLNKTGQQHVSSLLIEDGENEGPLGAVAKIVATTTPADNRMQRERRIVDQLTALLRIKPGDRVLIEALENHIEQLSEHEVTLVEAEIGHSIGLFYLTRSLRGLQYLREVYYNEQLKSTIQEIFIMLLKTDDADEVLHDQRVDTLRWDPSNYFDCLQKLCTNMDLPIQSRIYEMANQNKKYISLFEDVRSLPIDQLPVELIEIVLIRATCHLFVAINRRMPGCAEIYTLATMMAVSHLWWIALSHRKFIRRSLKRIFKRVCHPFKCSPQQVKTLHIAGDKNVRGVAVLNNELYVACAQFNTIQVFDSRPPFSRHEDKDIKVPGFKDATDITVCSKSSQLYIADFAERAIWRVNLLSLNPADKLITNQWQPWSISVHSSRLLITRFDGDSLFLYGDDGKELCHIELPRYMHAHHAVETTRNSYIIGHSNRFIDDKSSGPSYGVTEVDASGRVICSFNHDVDSIHFKEPCYVVLDNGHVIVTDRDNERIVLLKSDLQFERILIHELHGKQPRRMCITSSRFLMIGYLHSTDIDIFQV